MRIGIYDPYLDTMSGGEKYMLSIASCLSENNEVSIFWNKAKEEEIKTLAKRKFDINLSSIPFKKNIFANDISTLDRLKTSREYDRIILLSDGSIPILATKLIVHFQTPMEWVRINKLKMFFKKLEIKKVICNSIYTQKYIDKKFSVKSTLLYPPVIIKKEEATKKENIILNVGRFGINHPGSSYKKQEVLVEAFNKMKKKDWKLVLVVSYSPSEKAMFESFKKENSNKSIEFIENPNSYILWQYYYKSKIYWHAAGFNEDLEKFPDRAEHFGISTVEAMGAGAVPIVINEGGQKEIVTNGENGFLWNTTNELIQKTERAIDDNKLLNHLSEEARKRALFFSLDNFCQRVDEIIK